MAIYKADPSITARIDHALCCKDLINHIQGIRLDKVIRVHNADHKLLLVDINKDLFLKRNDATEWVGDDSGPAIQKRIDLNCCRAMTNTTESDVAVMVGATANRCCKLICRVLMWYNSCFLCHDPR